MKAFKFFKPVIILIIAFEAYFTGCVKSNIYFGNDIINEGMRMKSGIDTFNIIKTYQFAVDSFATSSSGSGGIGIWRSDSIGTCTAGLVSNYAPYGFQDDTFFGPDSDVDSMKLTASFGSADGWGDSTVSMRVKVYRIDGYPFNSDSTYYTNFPIEKYIDPTPLATAITEVGSADTSLTMVLPLWYAKLHYDNRADSSNIYVRDRKFTNQINGFYFTAEPVNTKDRRLLQLMLSNSSLRLYYHNSTYPDSLLVQSFIFYNTNATNYTTGFQVIKNDYTEAKPELGGVDYTTIGDTLVPLKRTYVSAPSGLYTRLDFDTTALYELKRKATKEGFSHVAILNAELKIYLPNPDWASMDKVISTLKLYRDIQYPKFLNEYNPILVSTSSSSSSSYNSIGGALVRSNGYYSLNITGYIQRLITKAISQTYLELYPIYSAGASWGSTYLGGSEDPKYKPEIIVTYTFVQ